MKDPLSFMGEILSWRGRQEKHVQFLIKHSGSLFIILVVAIYGPVFRFWNAEPTFYAQAAYLESDFSKLKSPLLKEKTQLFGGNKNAEKSPFSAKQTKAAPKKNVQEAIVKNKKEESFKQVKFILPNEQQPGIFSEKMSEDKKVKKFAQKIYDIVGDTPIREMVPFISRRNEKVAAFLVAIAKKESSFGIHSPSLEGQTCYNFWGYKGSASRGSSMGYACFASAEEAIEIVGNRIEVLVNKNRNTPSKMVDTWKCGSSCAGDPGAPSWVSTVALYFEKIIS